MNGRKGGDWLKPMFEKESMAGWLRNPWNFSRALCILAGSIAGILWLVQLQHPSLNLSLGFAIPLTIFTASFSASMGMWLYGHITQQARDAQFRFDRIYQPLYDELLKEIESLERCNLTSLHKWREIGESSLREFVAPDVKDALDGLRDQFEAYHQMWNTAYGEAERILYSVVKEMGVGPDPSNEARQIVDAIRQDYRFLFDPGVAVPLEGRMDNIENYLTRAGLSNGKDAAARLAREAKAAFKDNQKIKGRSDAVETLRPQVERARRLLHQRLMRPLA